MRLTMMSYSYSGGGLGRSEFGYLCPAKRGGFNAQGVDGIAFYCPNGKNRICEIPLTLGPAQAAVEDRRWHWDGNMEAPTITPSIGCESRCGWHGNIINGETRA